MVFVEGDVVVETAGARLRVEATGSTIQARIQSADVLHVVRRLRTTASLVRRLVPLLVRAGMTLDVFAGTVHIARAGAGVRANRLGLIFKLANVRIGS